MVKNSSQARITYIESSPDTNFNTAIQNSLKVILKFSADNNLNIQTSEEFFNGAVLYGSKVAFDNFMKSKPDWPKGKDVPRTYVGVGENKSFHVVSWAAYREVFSDAKFEDYQKLITHEITHLFHIWYLAGKEDDMGPVWFYEGFACLVSDQYPDEPMPIQSTVDDILTSPERGNYKSYAALVRKLSSKMKIRDLLQHAKDADFSLRAGQLLLNK